MDNDNISDQCADTIQELSIMIPHGLAERAEAYAKETGNSITGVVIEALDAFLQDHKNRR